MIQGRVDRKEGATGRGRRAGKGWEWGGVLEAGRVDRKQARSQTFLWGGSNRSNFGTFYDYAWIILRSR